MCLYGNLAIILVRISLRAYCCLKYLFNPRLIQLPSCYYLLFFVNRAIFSFVLIYTNIIFYANLHVSKINPNTFVALFTILCYGYYVLLEAILFIVMLLMFVAILLCCQKTRSRPLKQSLLEKLKYVKYDEQIFTENSVCGICITEYNKESEIVILPCHAKYFLINLCIE